MMPGWRWAPSAATAQSRHHPRPPGEPVPDLGKEVRHIAARAV
jgi:hypothetical protein